MVYASTILPGWSESLLCAQWIAQDPRFLHADNKDWSDWADAQAVLSLCMAQISFCFFFFLALAHVACFTSILACVLFWADEFSDHGVKRRTSGLRRPPSHPNKRRGETLFCMIFFFLFVSHVQLFSTVHILMCSTISTHKWGLSVNFWDNHHFVKKTVHHSIQLT